MWVNEQETPHEKKKGETRPTKVKQINVNELAAADLHLNNFF